MKTIIIKDQNSIVVAEFICDLITADHQVQTNATQSENTQVMEIKLKKTAAEIAADEKLKQLLIVRPITYHIQDFKSMFLYQGFGVYLLKPDGSTETILVETNSPPKPTPVSMTVEPEEVSIAEGATSTIVTAIQPVDAVQTVTSESGDIAVATVSGKVITGVAAGTTTVTFTSTANNAVIKVVNVTVTEA